MKKIISLLLVLGMAASVMFATVGCGVMSPATTQSSQAEDSQEPESSEEEKEPSEEEEESSEEPESSEEEEEPSEEPESSEEEDESSSIAISGKFNSIDEYVNSDLLQGQMESLKESVQDAGMDIELVGEGNKLVYIYTLPDEYAAIDGFADSLAEGLESQASTFESVASSLKLAVNVEDPIVEVRYVSESGDVIYSQEFSAK